MPDDQTTPLPGGPVDPEAIRKIALEQEGAPRLMAFDADVITGIAGCSACGKNHHSMRFVTLVKPQTIQGHEYTHVGICPNTDEWVYLRQENATKAGTPDVA